MNTNTNNKTGCTFIDNTKSPFMMHWTFLMRPPYNMPKKEMELYSLMHDRQLLSRYSLQQGQTNWSGKNGQAYFFLEASQVQNYMGISNRTWLELKKSLVNRNMLTIEEKRGFSTRYYLKTVDNYGITLKGSAENTIG